MKLFISWSGEPTKNLAELFRTWLPKVLVNKVETFVSSQDIEKGQRGLNVIASNLEEIDFGLVLLTKANQDSKWINFEAGALGKSLGKARVTPLLVDLTDADVTGPLLQFQMTNLESEDDVWKLIIDINNALDEPLPEPSIRILFDASYAELGQAVTAAKGGSEPSKTTRSQEDMLEEILHRVRQLETKSGLTSKRRPSIPRHDEVVNAIHKSLPKVKQISFSRTGTGAEMVRIEAGASSHEDVDHTAMQELADRFDLLVYIRRGDTRYNFAPLQKSILIPEELLHELLQAKRDADRPGGADSSIVGE